MKKTIAIIMVVLMALTVVSTAGVAVAQRPNNEEHNRVITANLYTEKRDEDHKWIGKAEIKKVDDRRGRDNDPRERDNGRRDNDRFDVKLKIEKRDPDLRGEFKVFAEKKLDRDRFTRDERLGTVHIRDNDRDHQDRDLVLKKVEIPRYLLQDPHDLVIELVKVTDHGRENHEDLE